MAHLTRPKVYDIEDSNIALLGSDLEKRVREHAGDIEAAWTEAGVHQGLEIWRVEQFHIVAWPKDRYGTFYDGDSYIILRTYKQTAESEVFSYDLHFWLGQNTTQDEAGTAAYKTVELDDHLKGTPVQYREIQGFESTRFLSHFPHFTCLSGGVATGFHHVAKPPPTITKRLFHISAAPTQAGLIVREVPPVAASLIADDVYVLDKGSEGIWQFNTKGSKGKEKYKAAEFVQTLLEGRSSDPGAGAPVTVFDEGSSGSSRFLSEFGEGVTLLPSESKSASQTTSSSPSSSTTPLLFRLSDALSGTLTFTPVPPPVSRSSLDSSDAFLLDDSANLVRQPAVYAWIGKNASLNEKRMVGQYAQQYLYRKGNRSLRAVAVPVLKVHESWENEDFWKAITSS